MSFIYSRALVEASSQDKCSGIDAFVPSSGNPTHKLSSSPDKTTAAYRLSRFGMTCAPLTADRGAELLTSWLAGFHVRTSALPERAQASTGNGQACGDTWRGSLARFDPASSSWRTVQPSLLGDSDELSVTWPRSGMTAAGLCWELPMLELRTRETASGLWPTPVKFDAHMPGMMPKNGDTTRLDRFGKPRKVLRDGRTASMGVSRLVISLTGKLPTAQAFEALMLWPIGWTGLKPLGTAKSPSVRQQRSSCSSSPLTEAAA